MESEEYDALKSRLDNLASWLQWSEFKQLYEEKVTGNPTLARRVIIEYGHGGYTRLHYHLRYKPPADVVRVIVNSYPEAIYIQDHFGDTPLHCAINKSASVYVMQCLIQAQHQISTRHPDLLYIQNNSGDTPLHRATSNLNMQVLDLLIRSDSKKGTLLLGNGMGQSPLQLTIRQPQQGYDRVEEADGSLSQTVHYMIKQTKEALKRARQETGKDTGHGSSNALLLRTLIECAPLLCSSSAAKLIQVVLRNSVYNQQELERNQENGQAYIHFVAEAKWNNPCLCGPTTQSISQSTSRASSEGELGEDDDSGPIRSLLQQHPRGAELVNSRGEFPLHVALKVGQSWKSGVGALYEAYPHAAKCPDSMTGHMPFALAILPNKGEACTTTVFVLIRDSVADITFTPLQSAQSDIKRSSSGILQHEAKKRKTDS